MAKETTASPIKFDFSQDFAVPKAHAVRNEKITPEVLEAARTESYHNGYTEGQNSSEIQMLHVLDAKTQELFLLAAAALTQLDTSALKMTQDAIRIALVMAKTLSRNLLERFPQETIEQLAAECFRNMRNTPHIVFRVAPDLVAPLETRLQGSADGFGFMGRIIILGDPEFMNGDVRIEWADGGYEYNYQKIEQELEASIGNWINAQMQSLEGRN